MGKLIETLRPTGTVKWKIIRRDGNIFFSPPEKNTINAELKNKLADTLYLATSNFGLMNSHFTEIDLSGPPTDGDSGIILVTTGPSLKFEMDMSLDSSSSLTFTVGYDP